MSKCKPSSVKQHGCSPHTGTFTTFDAVVQAYITDYRQRARQELEGFKQSCLSLADAIRKAPWADKGGHQRRNKPAALTKFTRKLLGQEGALKEHVSLGFDHLHEQVKAQKVRDVGPVALYDTAFRLGGFLGYLPSRIYLHGGTRKGAKALAPLGKVNHRAESIAMTDLPPVFQKLQAHEVEDCLCIYRQYIGRIVSKMVSR